MLKLPQLSNSANKLYFTILDKTPSTLGELQSYLKDNKANISNITKELIEKNLLLEIRYQNNSFPTHYQALPPFGPINEQLNKIKASLTGDETLEQQISEEMEEIFENEEIVSLDTLYKDFKKLKNGIKRDTQTIRDETKELVDTMENVESITEFLHGYEEKLKETVSSEIASVVIELIKLKNKFPEELDKLDISDSQWDGIKEKIKDIMTFEIHKKAQEIQEMISNEFENIRKTLNEKLSLNLEHNFEQNSVVLGILNIFMTEIKKLHKVLLLKKSNLKKGIHKLSAAVQSKVINLLNKNFDSVEGKIEDITSFLTKLIEKYHKISPILDSLLSMKSIHQFKDNLVAYLEDFNENAIIIVPNIKDFIPLEFLNLKSKKELQKQIKNLQVEEKDRQKQEESIKRTTPKEKSHIRASATQKQEIMKKLKDLRKKAVNLKGYELTHPVSDLLALILEINEKSPVKQRIQSWLDRLTTIRKDLDSDLKYMFLNEIDKWEKDYLKVEQEKKADEKKSSQEEGQSQKIEGSASKKANETDNKIRIISTESHSNHIIRILEKIDRYEFKRLKENNLVGLLMDNFLIFGIYKEEQLRDSVQEILGFCTTNKKYINRFKQVFERKWQEATYEKDQEITIGFNKVLENINSYSGHQIGGLIEQALDFTFQKEGVSLNVLELKLLGKKLKEIYEPLCKEDKEEVINKIQELNSQISEYDLIDPPELRQLPSGSKESKIYHIEAKGTKERKIDEEKIEELFSLFVDKIDKLTGEQISTQISQFIELIMRFQGFSDIIEWKQKLSEISKPLDDSFKEELLKDFIHWKNDILTPSAKKKPPQTTSSTSVSQAGVSKTLNINSSRSMGSPSNGDLEEKRDLNAIANDLLTNVNSYTGTQTSKKLQTIMDIIMENQGFTSVPKVLKFWKGKLRMNRKRLPESLRDDFLEEFRRWYDDFQPDSDTESEKPEQKAQEKSEKIQKESALQQAKKAQQEQEQEQEPAEPQPISTAELSKEDREKLDTFDKILAELDELKGFEISKKLQGIMDDILETEGYSMALKDMRQWISKLRMIREPLKPEKKEEFLKSFHQWRDNYAPDTEEDEFDGYKPGFLK